MILMIGMLAYAMKRTTVKIPDDLDALLRHEAARRGVTISQVTREALESYLTPDGRRRLSFVASGSSGRSDISERIEEILREEWGR
jgi:plasmid stability protein